jgi:hypothetical protein
MATICITMLMLAFDRSLGHGAQRTTIAYFVPWSPGSLRAGFTVSQRIRGDCWTQSLVSGRPDAWRCEAGNEIYDPCFVGAGGPTKVACAQSPFSKTLVVMRLTKPIRRDAKLASTFLRPLGLPWGLRLTNGDTCVFVAGATDAVAGERLNYACGKSGWIFGQPDRSGELWVVHSANGPTNANVRTFRVASAIF